MCGIAGAVYFSDSARPHDGADDVLRSMVRSIRHRGPDSSGFHRDGTVMFGVSRLAVNGLADGDQPFTHGPTGVTIVCNGELYDFRDQRAHLERAGHVIRSGSDVEVLLHLYLEYGLDFVHRIDAEFACAIHDPRTRQVHLIRDRMGVRPLYYYQDGAKLVFGSEIKAIFEHPGVPRALDHDTMLCNLMRLDLLERSTFQDIRIVRPGTLLTIGLDGRTRQTRYWDFADLVLSAEPSHDTFEEAVERTSDLLRAAVRRRLDADVPVGAFLSGGLDSSLVTALMSEHGTVSTFSIEFEGAHYDEGAYSRRVAEWFGTDHHRLPVSVAEQCAALPEALFHCEHLVQQLDGTAKLLLAREAAAHVKCVMVGEGADEVFLGYPNHLSSYQINHLGRQDTSGVALRQTARHGIDHVVNEHRDIAGLVRQHGYYPMQADAIQSILGIACEMLSPELRDRAQRTDFLARHLDELGHPAGLSAIHREQAAGLQLTMPVYLFEFLGGKLEMAASLEGRLPFLDRDLVQYAVSLPAEFHLRGGVEKSLLRACARPLLPPSISERPKHGFSSPIAEGFFGKDRVEYFEHYTSKEHCASAGLFDGVAVDRIKQDVEGIYSLDDQERTMKERALLFVLSTHLIEDMFTRGPAPRCISSTASRE
ncbi:asparagine synthase (glutamine-hydrolyzing) [Streptomyces sp. NPDC052721]|uniref:asparagine synthase (glutamine-hydrolyzing) n=1 Tax=Streptomyces sp. NPDC052721 TaxID=3154955 RepID=UPI003443CE63